MALGGPAKLLSILRTSSDGLPKGAKGAAEVAARKEAFGANDMPSPDPNSWFELFYAAFEDTTVLILCAAAVSFKYAASVRGRGERERERERE